MKLNLDFSLYKGTTRLKQWWKEVKAHFTQVQEAHNDLQEKFDTHTASKATGTVYSHVKLSDSVTSTSSTGSSIAATPAAVKTAYDKAVLVQTNLNTEATARANADNNLQREINYFICADYNPIYLTDCPKTEWGYNFPPDTEINKFFKLENDTDSALTEFRGHDDYYTPLSCAINPGETRICVLLKKPSGGAEPQNGYLFVLDDVDTQKLISKETSERKNDDTTLQQNINTEVNARTTADNTLQQNINTEASARQTADTTLQQNINAEISARTTADNALDGRIKAVWKDMYGGYIVDGSFSDSDFQVQVDSSYSNATVTVTAGKSIKINGVQVSLPASFTISRISPADNVIQLYAEYDTTAKTIEWYCDYTSTYLPYSLDYNILQVYTCQIYFDLVYTDGVLVDVRPTVTSVGNIGLEITKNLSDLKTENKGSFLDAVNENAAKLHTHTNKSVLDGITADDIAAWDSIKEQVSRTQLDEAIDAEATARTEADTTLQGNIDAEATERAAADTAETNARESADNAIIAMLNAAKSYLEDMCFSFTDEFQRVYAAMGVTVYDGGIFGMEQSDIALDGGDFTEETTGNVDCGGFEPLTAEVSAVVDGGEY